MRISTTFAALLLTSSVLLAEPATIQRLDGQQVTGDVTELTATSLTLARDAGPQQIPLTDVLEVTFAVESVDPVGPDAVTLTDGTTLQTTLLLTGNTATFPGPAGDAEPLKVGRTSIRSVRFSPLDAKVTEAWAELIGRSPKEDLLIIRKGDVLDFISGAVGDITADEVAVLTGGRELQAPRSRLFGILFADRSRTASQTFATVTLTSGDVLVSESLQLGDAAWQIALKSGMSLAIPLGSIRKIDFGGGRIRPLADVPFDSSASTSPDPLFPVVWFVSRNSPAGFGPQGKPLKIGSTEYPHGLWMCSNAVLKFRLNREYQKLQTVAGFELTHMDRMPDYAPQVDFVVEGDGKELYRKTFHWNDPPETLDLDLTDVRELVLKVVSGSRQPGVLEFFALGEARLLK